MRVVAIEVKETGLDGIRLECFCLKPVVEFPKSIIGPIHTV